jgi:protein-S-isoprenylcysteine O-methyltransferase Ste14
MRPLVFTNGAYAIAFWIALAIWYIPEWIGSVTQRARADASASVQDRGSYFTLVGLMLVGLVLGFVVAIDVTSAALVWHRTLLTAVGIALILLGVALRWWAIRVLGRLFTRNVAVHTNQTVVQSGPYRFVRHPAYSGTLLTLLGAGLALTNWLSIIVILASGLAGHLYRVRVEEAALCKALGQPYEDYMRHTRRFIPFIF